MGMPGFRHSRHCRPVIGAASALVAAVATVAMVASSLVLGASTAPVGAAPAALPRLHATRDAAPGIFDSQGREVLLRGVNLNSLGDYYQANPAYPPTVPVTGADWDSMAAQGFSVVRLLVSWSFLEPSPGVIDTGYLAKVQAAVADAAARGMYSVIDMHQDAWGKFIASPPNVVCPTGLSPSIGWDGAPQWATYTDGAQTCHGSSREDSDAARHAWDNFYADHNGIQTHLVNVWGRLASTFAGNPAVAGYDLLNEPNSGSHPDQAGALLGRFYGRAIAAIRAAEAQSGAGAHIVFFEPTIDLGLPPADFTADTNLVGAPHNYAESLGDVPSIEVAWKLIGSLVTSKYHTTAWIGEYGWFGDPAQQKSKVERYARQEDAYRAGSAWWQWRQACGDPHTIGTPGGTPGATVVEYQLNTCPGDVNQGPIAQWQTVLSRPYPRAFPGRLTALGSDGDARTMYAAGQAGSAGVGGSFDVWVPGTTAPMVGGAGIAGLTVTTVAGGYRVTGTVCTPQYSVQVGGGASVPTTCPPAPTTTAPAGSGTPSAPATPIQGTPSFTG